MSNDQLVRPDRSECPVWGIGLASCLFAVGIITARDTSDETETDAQ